MARRRRSQFIHASWPTARRVGSERGGEGGERGRGKGEGGEGAGIERVRVCVYVCVDTGTSGRTFWPEADGDVCLLLADDVVVGAKEVGEHMGHALRDGGVDAAAGECAAESVGEGAPAGDARFCGGEGGFAVGDGAEVGLDEDEDAAGAEDAGELVEEEGVVVDLCLGWSVDGARDPGVGGTYAGVHVAGVDDVIGVGGIGEAVAVEVTELEPRGGTG